MRRRGSYVVANGGSIRLVSFSGPPPNRHMPRGYGGVTIYTAVQRVTVNKEAAMQALN